MDSLIGKSIGRYQIVELLGRGGMAEVYKAYQASLDRYVAIKLMHSFLADESDFFARFDREAKNVAALRHPHIIQIHDFDQADSVYYMVMEFIDGGTLKEKLESLAAQGRRLPLDDALRIIKDVGTALSFAHKRGMIHRDIKPANIMLDGSGRVVLTDFGIAKILSGAKHTASGSILGTPSYMAPEQGLGQPGDARADVYALGVVLYQLATGQLPFEADTPIAVILKHVNDPLLPPRTVNPALPEGVQRIIMKAMAKEVNERYQSVDDMLSDLNNLDAAARIELPVSSTVAGRRGEATIRAVPDATKGGTVVGKPSAQTDGRKLPIGIILGGLAVLFVGGIVGAAAIGGSLLAAARPTDTPVPTTAAPTATPTLAGTPTIDPALIAATQLSGTLAALQATPTHTATPNLTATYIACVFDVTLASQDPADGASIAINSEKVVALELTNSGSCGWADDTLLAFDSGDAILHDTALTGVHLPAAQPGETVKVELVVELPQAKTYVSRWQVRLANGRDVGSPLALTYKGIAATTAAPRATSTPTAQPTSAATATPAGGGALQSGSTIHFCEYVSGTSDYRCWITISTRGGTPPYNVIVDGNSAWSGTSSPTSDFGFYRPERRCNNMLYTWRITDSAGQTASFSGFFEPLTNKRFNNNTEVCGLG